MDILGAIYRPGLDCGTLYTYARIAGQLMVHFNALPIYWSVKKIINSQAIYIDSTVVRAHQHSAGAQNHDGCDDNQAIGRSKGGLTTKIHLVAIDENTGISIILTGGNEADCVQFSELHEDVKNKCEVEAAVMDKGYDTNKLRDEINAAGGEAVIPPKKNRVNNVPTYDKEKYKHRRKIENLFAKMKQFRSVATRYTKKAVQFKSIVLLALIVISLR